VLQLLAEGAARRTLPALGVSIKTVETTGRT
jgi:hypothetical protein